MKSDLLSNVRGKPRGIRPEEIKKMPNAIGFSLVSDTFLSNFNKLLDGNFELPCCRTPTPRANLARLSSIFHCKHATWNSIYSGPISVDKYSSTCPFEKPGPIHKLPLAPKCVLAHGPDSAPRASLTIGKATRPGRFTADDTCSDFYAMNENTLAVFLFSDNDVDFRLSRKSAEWPTH